MRRCRRFGWYVIISRVSYSSEGATAWGPEYDDLPSEIPEGVPDDEPELRLWLSNKYLSALVGHDYGSVDITRGGIGHFKPFELLVHTPHEQRDAVRKELQQKHQWWRFDNETDFRSALQKILEIIISDGLNWFEEQVADIRRYHQKLDDRRKAVLNKIARKVTPS
jgi:hypothetical protein